MRVLVRPALWAACFLPLALLVRAVLTGRTSANPAEDVILGTGIWALRFLLLSLAITPLRRLTGWHALIGYRRMLGLCAFIYATLHVAAYAGFDQLFDPARVAADVAKRPFIAAGMLAFLSMVPLAATSTRGWIRRLGRSWRQLHRLVYLSAAAACVHFLWKVKVVAGAPVVYAAVLAVLLGMRVAWRLRSTRRGAPQAAAR